MIVNFRTTPLHKTHVHTSPPKLFSLRDRSYLWHNTLWDCLQLKKFAHLLEINNVLIVQLTQLFSLAKMAHTNLKIIVFVYCVLCMTIRFNFDISFNVQHYLKLT